MNVNRGKAMNIQLASIEMDVSIQCRATIDTAVVNEYAEAMNEGDKFPPVVLFGDKTKCWIGDGWHRIMAARQVGAEDIAADLRKGGRADALKHALGANALHGHRRTNADKRRCIEIALREFPKLSNSAIGKMCGVADTTVATYRPATIGNTEPEKRTGSDGKQYPATRAPSAERQEPNSDTQPTVTEGREEPSVRSPQSNIIHGSFGNWQQYREKAEQVITLLKEMADLRPDRDRIPKAREYIETISGHLASVLKQLS